MSASAVALLICAASSAQAQTAAAGGGDDLLSEVVVTATKQADTVNRVPLSVAAVTQNTIDRQGIKNVQDLSRTVPSLVIFNTGGASNVNVAGAGNGFDVSIRGIRSGVGAPTTSVYLDDTPLQRYGGPGQNIGNGTVFPQLFDLERVEVLKGPQGTLYGGSAEGGTIRFITPTPSLTKYSGSTRLEVADTKDGGLSYEGGVSFGGPIVEDKLGMRISVIGRHTGGYIDHVSRYTGKTLEENTNTQNARAGRIVLLWKPTERLSISPALYMSYDHAADASIWWKNIPAYTLPNRVTGTFVYPGRTYGPYNMFGPYKTGTNCLIGENFVGVIPECVRKQPNTSRLMVPSLSVGYEFDKMSVKLISSYVESWNKGYVDNSPLSFFTPLAGSFFTKDVPLLVGTAYYRAATRNWSDELRFSSNNPDSRLSWVAGLFYSYSKTNARIMETVNGLDDALRIIRGQTVAQFNGVPLEQPGNIIHHWRQNYTQTELAAFGEATLKVTDKFKLIGGLRQSRNSIDYFQEYYGSRQGFLVPTVEGGGLVSGNVTQSPLTPKFGAQYLIDDTNMLYATAAKGFRQGGINQQPNRNGRCAPDLAAIGGVPKTYESDSLWSYEGGAKLRLLDNKLQLNTALFWIDWKNIQTSYLLPTCGSAYMNNAGSAVSRGVDLQASYRVAPGLNISTQIGYTDAYYNKELRSGSSLLISKGQELTVPKWTVALHAEYTREIVTGIDGYIRLDYQYAGSYVTGFGPGTLTYTPDVYHNPSSDTLSARVGITKDRWELSVFANNLLNSQDVLFQTGGRGACAFSEACIPLTQINPATGLPGTANYTSVFQQRTFTPRTLGVTLKYDF
jgi:outer membrane receptor protein involved in Fe transport